MTDNKRIQQRWYDEHSEQWQQKRGKTYYIEDMLRLLPNISGTVLEVSAGRFTSHLSKRCDKLNVIDISKGSLFTIKNQNINRIQGDAVSLPFCDRAFDYTVGFGVLHHVGVDGVEAVLTESIRVSRKGVFFLIERNPLELYYSLKVLLLKNREEYGMFKLPSWRYNQFLKKLNITYSMSITDFASVGFPSIMYKTVKIIEDKLLRHIPFVMNFASHINIYINKEELNRGHLKNNVKG